MTIIDEELLKFTSSLFTEQKGSSDLPPEPLQGNPQRTNCNDSSLATTNCPSTAVLPKWGFISKETHRQKGKKMTPISREKKPQKKEFQDSWIPGHTLHQFSHLLQITSARLGTLTSAPVPLQIIHLKPKRDWLTANGSLWASRMKGTTCQEHPGDSWGPTCSSEVPRVPRTSRCPKRSQNRHTPNTDPTGPRGRFPRYLIFSLVRWQCGKVESWYFTAWEDLPFSSRSQGFFFYLFNLQRRYWWGMSAASWQWQTELRPDYSTLDGTDTQFQWSYFDPASHEPIIRIQKF